MNNKPFLEDLRLYCAVVRNRGFAASARELGVSKAFVSKRIGLLEDVDRMAEAVSTARIDPSSLLRLCTSSGFGRNRVAPALSALARRYPGLEIQLELLDRPVDLVGEGFQPDIRIGAVREPNLISRRIGRNARVLCAAPASLGDLARHRCIVIRERDQDFGRWTLTGPRGIILRSIWDVAPAWRRATWCGCCRPTPRRPTSGPSILPACPIPPRSGSASNSWRSGSTRPRPGAHENPDRR